MLEQVEIHCEIKSDVTEITDLLRANGLTLSLPPETRRMGGLTPDLVVTGANVLIALANVIFSFLTARQGRQVKLKGIGGWEVTIPANTPQAEVARYIRTASSRTPVTLIISQDNTNS